MNFIPIALNFLLVEIVLVETVLVGDPLYIQNFLQAVLRLKVSDANRRKNGCLLVFFIFFIPKLLILLTKYLLPQDSNTGPLNNEVTHATPRSEGKLSEPNEILTFGSV